MEPAIRVRAARMSSTVIGSGKALSILAKLFIGPPPSGKLRVKKLALSENWPYGWGWRSKYTGHMANIAFIGLGVMGGPIAGHLAKAGHSLTVYNRSIGKAKSWAEAYGGAVAISPAKAAEEADIVISCVGTDDDLSQVTLGREGAFRTMKPGGLFIDHTTVSARIARQLFVEGESRGIHSVDAPVSGGQAGAVNRRSPPPRS
jgi:3-hydroxyisobutyrate dehydrogenase